MSLSAAEPFHAGFGRGPTFLGGAITGRGCAGGNDCKIESCEVLIVLSAVMIGSESESFCCTVMSGVKEDIVSVTVLSRM